MTSPKVKGAPLWSCERASCHPQLLAWSRPDVTRANERRHGSSLEQGWAPLSAERGLAPVPRASIVVKLYRYLYIILFLTEGT